MISCQLIPEVYIFKQEYSAKAYIPYSNYISEVLNLNTHPPSPDRLLQLVYLNVCL